MEGKRDGARREVRRKGREEEEKVYKPCNFMHCTYICTQATAVVNGTCNRLRKAQQ